MADLDTGSRPVRGLRPRQLWPAAIALVLALAAPAVSLLPALMTGVRGTGAAISFPHGFAATLLVTAAVVAAACAAGAWLARRAGLAAIPLGLAPWLVVGIGVVAAGLSLGHAHLTDWGIVLLAAVAAGLAAGLPLAATRP
jgi:hypothetical protein